jgi:hypothetical protein
MFTMQLFAMHQAGLIQVRCFVRRCYVVFTDEQLLLYILQLYAAPPGGSGVRAAPVAFIANAVREVFCPASMEDLRRAGNVAIDALAPAHIMSRNYLRFDTMVLLTRIGE